MLEIQINRGYENTLRARLDTINLFSCDGTRVLLGTTSRNDIVTLKNKIHLQSIPLEGENLLYFCRAFNFLENRGYTVYRSNRD